MLKGELFEVRGPTSSRYHSSGKDARFPSKWWVHYRGVPYLLAEVNPSDIEESVRTRRSRC